MYPFFFFLLSCTLFTYLLVFQHCYHAQESPLDHGWSVFCGRPEIAELQHRCEPLNLLLEVKLFYFILLQT